LVTWAQLCPTGQGPGNVPVGGMIKGENYVDNYVAVEDENERWVQISSRSYTGQCGYDKCTSCRGHIQAYGHKAGWGRIEDGSKTNASNNYVFCHIPPTQNPTPNPTEFPTKIPTSSPTALIEGNVGNGCINTIKISHAYETKDFTPCDACAFCAGSSLNTIFNPYIYGMCVDCSTAENPCNLIRIITSFTIPWVMKYVSLSPSEMSVDSDPEVFVIEASNNLQDWFTLYSSEELTFGNRSESEDFVFSENAELYKHYATIFVRKTSSSTMHVGHYGIVESYTKQCASNIFNDITGNDVVPYKEVV